ncbi:MAG: type II toxin-antitoxin system VapC family toxin [Candidatus Altiarchaeota archaeon]|nr:type II toxin-antitoxin system VapC family toxin [Candidatus Altiarchaeota archaeon]
MIVVDASVFIDLIFDYSSERTAIADGLFKLIEEKKIPIFQPDAFKIEVVGQLVRRLKKEEAASLAEEIFGGMNFIGTSDLFDIAFSIAFQTGSRAIDSFYIAAAKLEEALLVSNDKRQVESARKFGADVFYLLDEFEEVKERLAR